MVRREFELKIRIRPKNAANKQKQIYPEFIKEAEKTLKEFGEMMEEDFKRLIPVRSGATRSSINVKTRFSRSEVKANYTISGSENVNRLDKGTRPSPGAYADWLGKTPPLGRRFINPRKGWHGGMRGLNIVRQFNQQLQEKEKQVTKELDRKFNMSAKRKMK